MAESGPRLRTRSQVIREGNLTNKVLCLHVTGSPHSQAETRMTQHLSLCMYPVCMCVCMCGYLRVCTFSVVVKGWDVEYLSRFVSTLGYRDSCLSPELANLTGHASIVCSRDPSSASWGLRQPTGHLHEFQESNSGPRTTETTCTHRAISPVPESIVFYP